MNLGIQLYLINCFLGNFLENIFEIIAIVLGALQQVLTNTKAKANFESIKLMLTRW